MNKCILKGRITRELELKTTQNGLSVLSFCIAVDRRTIDQNGNKQTDFIDCVAWRNNAEFIFKYFGKGKEILICGEIQKREYESNGQKRYATEIVVNEAEFCGSKNSNANGQAPTQPQNDGFMPVDDEDDDLPFN